MFSVILAAMAIPAASSIEELIRLPVDNCCIAVMFALSLSFRAECAANDLILVLMAVKK
jgi:hypothetical protein